MLDAIRGVFEHRPDFFVPAGVHMLGIGHQQCVDRVPILERGWFAMLHDVIAQAVT
jgi:hypothetical protein